MDVHPSFIKIQLTETLSRVSSVLAKRGRSSPPARARARTRIRLQPALNVA
jgi:hypothetical protein